MRTTTTTTRATLLTIFIVTLTLFSSTALSEKEGLGRGWPEEVDWKTYSEGLVEMKRTGKPMMVIFHKEWCGACKGLKEAVGKRADKFVELSKDFVMVNIMDEPEAEMEEHTPDGGYIPRVIFYNPATGKADHSVFNKRGNPSYKFFYQNDRALFEGMGNAKKALSKGLEEL